MTARLIIVGVVVLAFMALGGVALWYRAEATQAAAERDQARAALDVAIDANRAQEATIGRLRATQEANDKLVAEMAADIEAINGRLAETNQSLGDLKDASDDVRAYLAGRVPAELDQLLNR